MTFKNLLALCSILLCGLAALLLPSCGSSKNPSSPSAPTNTFTATHTSTTSDTPTITPTNSPTNTPTNSPTVTSSYTATNSPTITETSTPTSTPTNSPTPTISNTATDSPTPTISNTATNSPTVTITNTPTITFTAVYPFQQTVAHPVYNVGPIALTDAAGSVTIMAGGSNSIYYLTGTDTGSFSVTNFSIGGTPAGMAWSSYNQNFYTSVTTGSSACFIQRFTAAAGNPGGGSAVTYAYTPSSAPGPLAVDAAGNYYVADSSNYTIYKFDYLGNPVTNWGAGVYKRALSLAYDPVNVKILAVCSFGGPVTFISSNTDGTNQTITTTLPASSNGCAVDPSGNIFILLNYISGNLAYKYTNAMSLQCTFGPCCSGAGHIEQPTSIAVDSSGYVYVADTLYNSDIVEYAPY